MELWRERENERTQSMETHTKMFIAHFPRTAPGRHLETKPALTGALEDEEHELETP